MNIPPEILPDTLWSFCGDKYDSMSEFSDAVRKYQIDITKKDSWNPKEAVLGSASVKILHEFINEEDKDENHVENFSADNGSFFTAEELLFKIHNAFINDFENQDHVFFEGFRLLSKPNEPLLYYISLGS
jgi:hypothetical protein